VPADRSISPASCPSSTDPDRRALRASLRQQVEVEAVRLDEGRRPPRWASNWGSFGAAIGGPLFAAVLATMVSRGDASHTRIVIDCFVPRQSPGARALGPQVRLPCVVLSLFA